MKRVPFFALLTLLFIVAISASAATENQSGMTTQILTATSHRTVVAAEFDEAVTVERLATLEPGARITDGLGSLLAIAGHGTPTANITHLELGEALSGIMSLDERDVANNVDELVIVGEPAIVHDLRVVSVGYRPLLRDPDGVVRTVTIVEVEITTSGGGGVNEKNEPTSFSSAFYPVYQATIQNLDELYPEMTLRPPGRYLVIAPRAFEVIQPTEHWQNWSMLKTRKGYQLEVVTLPMIHAQFGDSNAIAIKQYIQQAYAEGDLEYLMLLGDVSSSIKIPGWMVVNPEFPGDPNQIKVGDNPYLTVDGDDYLPDILCGRVSVNTPTDVARYFSKVYGYETDPYRDNPSWFEKAIGAAGNYSDGFFPVTPVWNTVWARNRLMDTGCMTQVDSFFYHDNGDPQFGWPIPDSINQGRCLVIYRGWAAQDGWHYPWFTLTELGDVQTGRRLPAFFADVCGSADFAWTGATKCFGEMLTTGMGSVATPNGAIIYYGASDIKTNTRHNNAMLAGQIDAMLINGLRSSSAIAAVGELLAYQQFPLERDNDWIDYYVFHVFNLLGDPETQIYVCQPQDLSLTYAPLTNGTSLVDVAVTSGGSPVENVVVTLRDPTSGDVWSEVTDALGHAWVSCDLRNTAVAQVTAWKGRYFMQYGDAPVSSADFDPAIESVNWQDVPNPGETVSFTLTVQYLGASASTLAATLTSLDPHVTIVNGSGTFDGLLQPNQTATSSPMSLALTGEIGDGQRPRVQVTFTGNSTVNRIIEVPVTSPDPLMLAFTVNDGGNQTLDPGETNVSVSVTVRNNGHQDAANLTATVYSWDNSVSFPDAQVGWGNVAVGQSVVSSDPFHITVAGGVTPGRQVQLRYQVFENGVEIGRRNQLITVGVVTPNAPSGPDAYGYYAYEDIDVGPPNAVPDYGWIELDPLYGGEQGAIVDSVGDDSFFVKTLPESFTFYGQTFNTIWICSNGWFSFVDPHLPEFRNWELPMTMAPWLLVAPFWEDLEFDRKLPNDDSLGAIWSRWYPPDRFVIMWRALNRAGLDNDGNFEWCTFEAILEYPSSGDGSILCQYNQVFQDDNDGNQSNYSTVGIQNYYMQTGLTLTYANMYPASVGPLQPGRAIRFTTVPPDGFLGSDNPVEPLPTEFALHDAYPNPFNPLTELRFDLPEAGRVTLKVYDVLGREHAALVDEFRAAGRYHLTFDARALPSGLYFARLESHGNTQVKKLMLVK